MQEAKTIARPYTTAIFEIASGTGQFEEWEKFINELSDVVDNPDFKSVELGAISGALNLSDFLINFIRLFLSLLVMQILKVQVTT